MSRSIDTVFSFINSSLPVPVDVDDFVFGLPEFHNQDVNTKIQIRPKISTAKYGSFWFYYNRVQLENIEDLEAFKQDALTLHGLFPQLNQVPHYFLSIKTYGNSEPSKVAGYLYEEDFVNQTIPNIGFNTGINMVLKAVPNSYLFVGQTTVQVKKNL